MRYRILVGPLAGQIGTLDRVAASGTLVIRFGWVRAWIHPGDCEEVGD